MVFAFALAVFLTQAPPPAVTPPRAPTPPPPAEPFSEETVQKVIESHRVEVEACLSDSIAARTSAKKPLREGAVVVRFTISPKGRVREASIKRTEPKSKEFQSCLLEHIKTWTFPKPDDKKSHPIEYPFDVKLQR